MTVLVVDYGRGNLFSIGQALRHLDVDHQISSDPKMLDEADRIIFPGVGAFGDAMQGLRERGLVAPLKSAAKRGVPILGICIGCQLLLSRSEEHGDHDGLDLIPGVVRRLPEPGDGDQSAIRIPNVGWRKLAVQPGVLVLSELGPDDLMYFVHSYAPFVERSEDIAATIPVNGTDLPVVVCHENILGVQFHPEKSGPSGLKLLASFFQWADARQKVQA